MALKKFETEEEKNERIKRVQKKFYENHPNYSTLKSREYYKKNHQVMKEYHRYKYVTNNADKSYKCACKVFCNIEI